MIISADHVLTMSFRDNQLQLCDFLNLGFFFFFFLSFFFLFSVQEMSKLALLDHPAPQLLSLKSTEPFLN